MGVTDFGSQEIAHQFFEPADSSEQNRRQTNINQLGIYKGGYLTKVTDTSVNLSKLVCEIGDAVQQARVSMAADVLGFTVGVTTPFVVLRWVQPITTGEFMDVLALSSGDVQTNDLIVGRVVFAGSTIIGFDYGDLTHPRTAPNTQDQFLKVVPTVPASMQVRVKTGRVQDGIKNVDIDDQLTSVISAPSVDGRKDLILIDTDSTVKIKQGVEAPTPLVPDYEGKNVLAEITLNASTSSLDKPEIKDVRANVGGGGKPFESGTKMMFKQNSVPLNWTFVVEDNDRVIINTSVLANGGAIGGTWTLTGVTTGNRALTIAQLASHQHATGDSGGFTTRGGSGPWSLPGGGDVNSVTNTAPTGSGSPHNHPIAANNNWRPLFVNVITCSQN